jgi:TolB-like protein/Tfp pilus assembly protein PilF
MSFFGELGRRNVIRVGFAYAIVAWLVIQVADIVLETIGAPAWVMQTLMLLLALGFIIATIFAWVYEVTPEGVKRESEIDRTASITPVTGRKLDRVITGLLVVALTYFVWESRFAERDAETAPAAVAADEPVTAEVEVVMTPAADLSIAVLPFDNRSALPEDAFFAEGMHDDLLTTLAKIGSMKVISRTSVMEYRDTTKKIPEIARELGVANILEGGVQRAGNQVRINVQLIDAVTDEHLWAETFDRQLTAENLFAIQSEISKAIADALHATLSPEELQRIDTAPTDNLEAFDHYLRARNLMATRNVNDLEAATREFLKAVELDPQFALAWIGVADSHALLESYGRILRSSYFEIRDDAINRALEIDPRLGEAYASLGSLQNSKGDVAAAEQSFKQAIRLSPNYATSYHWLSNMLRTDLYRVEEALVFGQRAAELDPNSAVILANLAGIYSIIGDDESFARLTDQVLEIDPDFSQALGAKAELLFRQGNFAGAIEADRKVVEVDAGSAFSLFSHAELHASIGAFDEAREIAQTLGERFPDHPVTDLANIRNAIAEGGRPDARPVITRILDEDPAYLVAYYAGDAALGTGQLDLALRVFNYVVSDDLTTMDYSPEFMGNWSGLLCTFSWLLQKTPGAEDRGRELLSRTITFFENELPDSIRNRERFGIDACYVLAGEPQKALDILERQFENHFILDWRWSLQLPLYDPLRDEPRFIALQRRYDDLMAEQVAELRREKRPAFEF